MLWRPSRVKFGSSNSTVSSEAANIVDKPPVAIIFVDLPSSCMSLRLRPSIIATMPNIMPDCILVSVVVPIRFGGNCNSTAGNFAATEWSIEIVVSGPAAIMPPR